MHVFLVSPVPHSLPSDVCPRQLVTESWMGTIIGDAAVYASTSTMYVISTCIYLFVRHVCVVVAEDSFRTAIPLNDDMRFLFWVIRSFACI